MIIPKKKVFNKYPLSFFNSALLNTIKKDSLNLDDNLKEDKVSLEPKFYVKKAKAFFNKEKSILQT